MIASFTRCFLGCCSPLQQAGSQKHSLVVANQPFVIGHCKISQRAKVILCSVAQWCPTVCDPMDCSLPGSSVHRILQARIQEYWSGKKKKKNTGVGCHFLLQGIFPGIEPTSLCLLHWRVASTTSTTWEAQLINLDL